MTGHPPVCALRNELLQQTVDWCRQRSTFYRQRFEDVEPFRGLEDLPRLPVLHRSEVVAHHQALRCDDSLAATVQHTTGTTGAFLQLYRSQAEQSFIWEFFAAQLAVAQHAGPRPLYVSLANAYHGNPISVPSRAYILSVGVHDKAQASQARGVIERQYDLPGVESRPSVITGTERMIMALTAYLEADGFDFAASSVKTLVLFGGHVPPSRKRLLARMWNARVKDSYSLTEMFGGAREIGIGGPWVFDPHVVPEVVHPRTFAPTGEGEVGVLLLTSLYPFAQQMPLVRYLTGDLAEVVADHDAETGLQVRYVGRMPRSILDLSGDTPTPLLLSGPLYEALIEIPDVAITPRFPDLGSGSGLDLTGDLHYAVDHEDATDHQPEQIVLRLGLRYAPWMYPDRVEVMVRQLVDKLFASHPALAARCIDGRLAFRVEPRAADAVAPYDSK